MDGEHHQNPDPSIRSKPGNPIVHSPIIDLAGGCCSKKMHATGLHCGILISLMTASGSRADLPVEVRLARSWSVVPSISAVVAPAESTHPMCHFRTHALQQEGVPIRLPRRRVGGTVMPSAFETRLEFGRLLHRQGSGRGWRRRRYFFKYSFIFSASSATVRKVSS